MYLLGVRLRASVRVRVRVRIWVRVKVRVRVSTWPTSIAPTPTRCRASAHRFASPTDQWEQLIYHSPQWLAQPTLFSPAFVESYVFGSSKHTSTVT